MTMASNFTITTSGMSTGTLHTEKTPNPPTDLIRTQVQQTIAGWVGQVLVVGDVVYESEPHAEKDEAIEDANTRMLDRIKELFA